MIVGEGGTHGAHGALGAHGGHGAERPNLGDKGRPLTEKRQQGRLLKNSLGPWQSADYSAAQIIARLDTVASIIPVKNVIIGWTAQPEIYKEVGGYLHGKGIGMYLWLPVFAETEEVCDNTPAVDLWGREPANYDLAAGEGFRFNCPSNPANRANVVAVYDSLFADCGFDGAFLDRVRTQSFVGGVSNSPAPTSTSKFSPARCRLGCRRWRSKGGASAWRRSVRSRGGNSL